MPWHAPPERESASSVWFAARHLIRPYMIRCGHWQPLLFVRVAVFELLFFNWRSAAVSGVYRHGAREAIESASHAPPIECTRPGSLARSSAIKTIALIFLYTQVSLSRFLYSVVSLEFASWCVMFATAGVAEQAQSTRLSYNSSINCCHTNRIRSTPSFTAMAGRGQAAPPAQERTDGMVHIRRSSPPVASNGDVTSSSDSSSDPEQGARRCSRRATKGAITRGRRGSNAPETRQSGVSLTMAHCGDAGKILVRLVLVGMLLKLMFFPSNRLYCFTV